MKNEICVSGVLTAALLALAGCDDGALAPRTPTQIGAHDGANLEAMLLSENRDDEPWIWILVESPAQEVRVEVEGGESFQALSMLQFRVDSDGTANGRGRLLATNPTAVEYAVMLALDDGGVLRFEGIGEAQDFPRGQTQTVWIAGSIRLTSADPFPGGVFIAVGDVNAHLEDNTTLSWAILARVIFAGDLEHGP
jgi:hypothetical protein